MPRAGRGRHLRPLAGGRPLPHDGHVALLAEPAADGLQAAQARRARRRVHLRPRGWAWVAAAAPAGGWGEAPAPRPAAPARGAPWTARARRRARPRRRQSSPRGTRPASGPGHASPPAAGGALGCLRRRRRAAPRRSLRGARASDARCQRRRGAGRRGRARSCPGLCSPRRGCITCVADLVVELWVRGQQAQLERRLRRGLGVRGVCWRRRPPPAAAAPAPAAAAAAAPAAPPAAAPVIGHPW